MIEQIVNELTDALNHGRIKLDDLFDALGVEQSSRVVLRNLFMPGVDGHTNNIEQFKLIMHVYLQKMQGVEEEGQVHDERSELKMRVTENALLVGNHFAATVSIVPAHVPILPVVIMYGLEKRDADEYSAQLTTSMQSLVGEVEKNCKQTCALYALLSRDYQVRLQGDITESERMDIIHKWQQSHDFFSDYIKKSQQNIAILGAKIQELASQDRYKKAQLPFQLASAGLHLIGPVGSALSMAFSGALNKAGSIGKSYMANSANAEHMVLPDEVIDIRFDNRGDLLTAVDRIRYIESAELRFSPSEITDNGGEIRAKNLPTDKLAIEQFAMKVAKNLAKEQPHPVAVSLPSFEFKRTTTPNLKDTTLLAVYLDQLKQEIIELQRALTWYNALVKNIIEYCPEGNRPILSNARQIAEELSEKKRAIEAQIAEIAPMLNRDSSPESIKEKIKILLSYQSLTAVQVTELYKEIHIAEQAGYAKQTELTGDPKYVVDEAGVVIDPEFADYAAWQIDNIQSQLDAIQTLLNACDKMGNGRHISNIPQLIQQIQKQLQPIRPILNENEKMVFDQKIKDVVESSLLLDEMRLHELIRLHQEHADLFNLVALRRDLLDLQAKIAAYPLPTLKSYHLLNDVNEHLSKIDKRLCDESREVNSEHQSGVIKDLATISSLDPAKISQQHTLFITPSRQAFGLSKQEELRTSVRATVDRLLKSNMNIKNIQILPLQPLDYSAWLATRGDEKKLANAIEGLKTEMEWVNQLCSEPVQARLQTTVDSKITISNIEAVRQNYAMQIAFIEEQIKRDHEIFLSAIDKEFAGHHDSYGGNLAAKVGSAMTKHIRTSNLGSKFLQNAADELTRCKQELAKLDQFIGQEALNKPADAKEDGAAQKEHSEDFKKRFTHVTHPDSQASVKEDEEGERPHE